MPSFRQPGTVLTDHLFEVPLDHANPGGAQITVFAREVVAAASAAAADKLPWLCFLQGGPGRASPRPNGRDGWLDRALRDYRGLRRWVTGEYEHDGLRLSRGAVLDRLIGMVRGLH